MREIKNVLKTAAEKQFIREFQVLVGAEGKVLDQAAVVFILPSQT